MPRSTSGFGKGRPSRRRRSWRDDPATERQKELIDELDLGYSTKAIEELTKGQAKDILDEHFDNEDEEHVPDAFEVWENMNARDRKREW